LKKGSLRRRGELFYWLEKKSVFFHQLLFLLDEPLLVNTWIKS